MSVAIKNGSGPLLQRKSLGDSACCGGKTGAFTHPKQEAAQCQLLAQHRQGLCRRGYAILWFVPILPKVCQSISVYNRNRIVAKDVERTSAGQPCIKE